MGKPKIRFEGYSEDWEQRKLGELGTVQTCKRIFKEQTSEQGDIPFFKNGTIGLEPDSYISREVYEEFRRLYPYPEVGDTLISVVGSIGRTAEYTGKDEYFQDSNVVWLKTNGSINKKFLKISYQVIKWLIEGSTVKHLYNDNILRSEIVMPVSQIEQAKIAEFFEELDHLITLHQRKYDETKTLKKYMLQKMFPQNGEKVPEIRFDGFTEDWEQCKSGEIAPLRGGFAFKSNEYCSEGIPIVRISNILSDGSVGEDYAYYCEQASDEIYTLYDGAVVLAMSGATTGKVSVLRAEKGQKYYQNQRVGYFIPTDICDYSFVKTIMRSHLFTDQLSAVLVAGAQPNVSSKEIDGFEFLIPQSKEEQKKIGAYFTNLDHLIALHQRKYDELQSIKKFMLQNMFT